MNPAKDTDRDRLHKAVKASLAHLEPDRKRYAQLVKKFAGCPVKPKRGAAQPRLINLLRQSGSVLSMLLSSARPRYSLGFKGSGPQRAFARITETHLNELAEEIHLEESFAACVLSAYFKMGIAYIHYAEGDPLLFGDQWVVPGRPTLEALSYGDYFEDMAAQSERRLQYQGHDFDIPWSALEDKDAGWDQSVVSKLRPDSKKGYQYDSDLGEPSESAREAYGFLPNDERLIEDTLRCRAIYVPSTRKTWIWPVRMETKPLRVVDDKDPDGPYRKLKFDDVPDNTLPTAPAEAEEALDDMHNSIWRKNAQLIAQMRSFFTYEPGGEDDAKAMQNAEHGKYVRVKDNDSVSVRNVPGITQNEVAAAEFVAKWHNEIGGNYRLQAGTAPMAPTASQEEQLATANGSVMAKRKYKVQKFASECGEGLKIRLWHDKSTYRRAWMEIPGITNITGEPSPAPWYPRERMGEPSDYKCEVVGYSLTYRSPEQEAGACMQLLNDLQPMMPLFAQSGKLPNPTKILNDLAKMRNVERVLDWFDEAPPDMPQQAQQPLRQSPNTTRTSIQRNTGTASDQSSAILSAMSPATAGAA
jgi:hypothetical protein